MAVLEPAHNTVNLVLNSLEIKNFRAFRHLLIPRLGRVNLITGRNNVGKSSLLEAAWLYAYKGSPYILRQLLLARDEFKESSWSPNEPQQASLFDAFNIEEEKTSSLRYLFHGRKNLYDISAPITIGPIGSSESLSLSVVLFDELTGRSLEGDGSVHYTLEPSRLTNSDNDYAVTYLVVQVGDEPSIPYKLSRIFNRRSRPDLRTGAFQMVAANGLTSSQISQLWDNVVLTSLEDNVIAALKLVYQDVERISLVGDINRPHGRTPYVKVKGEDNPVPLRSFGDGINRLFGLTLALVNAQDGLVLLDEVESGLHYSVLQDVWNFLFQIAHRLNVQIFATTHSWECIEAFQKASEEDAQGEGALVRLENKNGDVKATVFDERRLAVVTREQIEVR